MSHPATACARIPVPDPLELAGPDGALWPRLLERQLEWVGPGAHIGCISSTPAERLRVLVAFFGGGLRHGEQCVYFADRDRARELTQLLRALGPGERTELDRGAVVVVTSRDQYVRDGHFDPRAMIDLQETMTARARSTGFLGLRIACDMSWVLGADIGQERALEYAALLNRTVPSSGRSILCQIDGPRADPVIRDVLRTHPITIIDERVRTNLFYEPADLLLGRGDAARAAQADLMVDRLRALTRRATAIFDLGRLMLQGASPGDLMRGVPALIAAELQLDHVQLFELLPSGVAVRLVGSCGLDRPAIGSVERLDPDTLMADTALRAGPVVIYDWRDETRVELPAALRDAGVTSSVGIVLSLGRGEQVYGFLSAHSGAPRIFSDDELLFLETVGHLLAYAFATARTAVSLRVLVENAPDLIVRFGDDLRIAYANPAIERVTGTAAESLIGSSSADLGILEALVPMWELLLGQVWRTGREQAYELTLRIPTGERVFDSRIIPELGPDGSVQSVLTISRDITEQRRAEADRSALLEQLLAQQKRVQELMRDRERTLERTAAAFQEHLSLRELHILRLLAAGWTNRQIGAEIGLTAGTVKNQVAGILSKLNVADRTQAAVRAVQLGLVERAEPGTGVGSERAD